MWWSLTQLICLKLRFSNSFFLFQRWLYVPMLPFYFTEPTRTLKQMSTTQWWPRHLTHNSIHIHTMKPTVNCPPSLRWMGLIALRHPHLLPPAQNRREKGMMEDELKMRGKDLVLTTLTTVITIQMVGAITALLTLCPTTAMANPLHPGVTVDIVPLRDIYKAMWVHCMTPEIRRRTWCWGGALCPGQLQRGWHRGKAPWPSCSSGLTRGGAWPPRRTSTGRSVENSITLVLFLFRYSSKLLCAPSQ